ncbi:MAG: lamin tail domain-containing protein [Candidatus Marinimicrobia bacterium]|nr:lamin tail domain-containing protein [Candidatus Neomarinimicrobiota bacterium]MBL7022811.1 lamin tail domain-containing protein [Candidatus Neomarinimicrobiota bacterium]MBL7109378.1 lamin tail domain-containing protein [Candidatus Neomarinimicrobiota bacterium]
MGNKKKIQFLFLLVFSALIGQTQIVIGEGLIGQDLLDYLVANYKPSNTLGYDNAREKLYGEIDIQNGNQLIGVYSGYTITISDLQNPLAEVTEQGMNCEHTWPQSYGAGSQPQRSDMHHLYPTRLEVNSSRNNAPFYEINDYNTDTWFRNDYSQSTIPSSNINEYSEKDNDTPDKFEPREDHKGNAARSIYYFYTMYQDVADETFFNQQKNTLKDWNSIDIVDIREYDRTMAIAGYQSGKANPFVLDSTLIKRIWFFEEVDPAKNIVINELHYNPSPDQGSDDDYEFLELYNLENEPVNLNGYYFSSGILYSFSEADIVQADSYLILAKNGSTYSNSIEWTSGNLGNTGETITLVNPDGLIVDQVDYGNSSPWPSEPNGVGPSLELINVESDNNLPSNWLESLETGGTPGYPNSVSNTDSYLQIILPNGGESLYIGQTTNIEWIAYNINEDIQISLYENGEATDVLAVVSSQQFQFEWEVTETLIISEFYQIAINDISTNEILDISDSYFSISYENQQGSDLIISEYCEGSSYNKYLEIFNPTNESINLSNYQIWKITNGGEWFEFSLSLTGAVSSNDVYVIYHSDSDPEIVQNGDITWTQANWNGDDAVGLAKNGELIDVVGVSGVAPNTAWSVSGVENGTKDHTLVRKPEIIIGETDWSISSDSHWIVYSQDNFDYLGFHTIETDQCAQILLGDFNLDEVVDLYDVLGIVDIILGYTSPTDLEICASDLNQNDNIEIIDVVLVVDLIINR